jgi:PAS domain S-box-containing protein
MITGTPGKGFKIPGELISPSGEFIAASDRIGLFWWYWDQQQRNLFLSPALLSILGYTPEEFDPSEPSIYKNIHPDDMAENTRRIRRLLSGEDKLYEIEYRIKDQHGEWQWYYNRGSVIRQDERGRATVIGGISMDISGQFKHLMSMVEEKEKFEFIFRNSNEAILVIDLEKGKAGRILDANHAAMELFENGPQELMRLISAEDHGKSIAGEEMGLLSQVLEKGFGRVEQKVKTGSDSMRWLEISAHSFKLTGGNLMIAIVKDITEGRMTEAALMESERMYRTLFDAADDPIGLFSVKGEAILLNTAFFETFGYGREEFMDLNWKEVVHPENQVTLDQLSEKLLKEGTLSMDYRVPHKSGDYLFVSAKSVLIRDESGEKDLIMTIIRDVTERKQAMAELKEAKERAEESDKLKSAFLANMSHEIRTPMNSIVGFSNLLLNPELDEGARSLYVNRVVRNSELLMTLISDIIDLAKIESGQLPIIYGRLKLETLMGDLRQYALDELKRLEKKDIEIIMETKDTDCEIETDVIRLTQIMKNLINNAIKFTSSGSVKIGCRRSASGKNVILFVEDTGVGIAPEHFDLIFEQFRQVDGSNTRKFGGTGLGLAICKNLVQMMGGRIWVESTEGNGALFQVEFPLNSFRELEPPQHDTQPAGPASTDTRTLSVLVVEDEQDSLELYREVFQRMGHEVVLASTGYEALKILEKGPGPDLVFMDVQMPVLSGTETMKIIKERYPHIRVIAQSAHALVGDRARFMQEGFDGYLPKPCTPEQLSAILSTPDRQ